MNRLRISLALAFCAPALACAQNAESGGDGAKKIDRGPAGVSLPDSGEAALRKFSVAPGLKVDLWAAEPLLENPVAFSFDHKGRAFVVETFRRRTSVPDIRKNMDWLEASLALHTVEERIAFLKKQLAPELKLPPTKDHADINGDGQFDWKDWTVESERVQLLEDADGDGHADVWSVFADGFRSLTTGTAAGVLARGDDVWFACIPDLWHFQGATGRQAASKTKLLSGFGVHVAYGGHDLHGVKIGPDGRLYWTIADCGAQVQTPDGKVLENPDSGAVFRSELDGSKAELYATGLRNPQSLAWNDLGDLFTGDNNADGGDQARWTHVVEGADYGWRIGWQFLPKLGAWNSEGMWHLDNEKTNIGLLPPVGLIGHGPAGIAYYPGTGLPASYARHFFCADFPGGVRAFAMKPKGASYTVANPHDILQDNKAEDMTGKLLWGLYPSDVQFNTNGGAYVLDWVFGWEKTGQGRIFRVHDPEVDVSPLVKDTKALLADGMTKRDDAELAKLLGHADQRVRLAAQFELVRRGDPQPLAQATLDQNSQLMRIHGLWGLAQLARSRPKAAQALAPLAHDQDSEVRAQWAKFVGESGKKKEVDEVIRLLADKEPRVRFFAAQALGKLGVKEAVPALIAMRNLGHDSDSFVRHAAAVSLAKLATTDDLVAAAGNESAAVRSVALLALSRQQSPEVARFLTDKNPQLIIAAARAIHDGPIPAAWPALAALAGKPNLPEPVRRRAVNAGFLVGAPDAAQRLAKIAGNSKADEPLRLDALATLAMWSDPPMRDRITGLVRPGAPPARDSAAAVTAAEYILPALLREPSEQLRVAALGMAGALKMKVSESLLLATVEDKSLGGETRAAALRALGEMDSTMLGEGVKRAVTDTDKILLEAARQLAAKVSPADAVKLNAPVLDQGSTREKQKALATIAAQPVPEADQIILAQLDKLAASKLSPALWLDVTEAAAKRDNPEIQRRLAERDTALAQSKDPLAKWRDCLEGGNAKSGRQIFAENAEAACMRCHKYDGEGGDVGPDLAKIAQVSDRIYLLESIVDPNAKIAPGYENVVLTLTNGEIAAGILNKDGAEEVTITNIADGKKQQVKTADIQERMHVPSAMPPGLADVLGKRRLRDVIEFLAGKK